MFNYLQDIICAIILFICPFYKDKSLNLKVFFWFMKFFFDVKVKVCIQNNLATRDLRKEVKKHLNQKFKIIDNSPKKSSQKNQCF